MNLFHLGKLYNNIKSCSNYIINIFGFSLTNRLYLMRYLFSSLYM